MKRSIQTGTRPRSASGLGAGADSPYNAVEPAGRTERRPWMYEFRAGPVEQQTINSEALTGRQLDDLLERPERILFIESADLAATLQQFESFARQTGKAVYIWRPEEGLNSLKVTDMRVPGSRRLIEALRYVAKSLHYGVYGFVDFEPGLKMDSIQLLREIARAETGYDRKVILLTKGINVPKGLRGYSAVVKHVPEQRLRLRDGRWVL